MLDHALLWWSIGTQDLSGKQVGRRKLEESFNTTGMVNLKGFCQPYSWRDQTGHGNTGEWWGMETHLPSKPASTCSRAESLSLSLCENCAILDIPAFASTYVRDSS